MKTDMPSSGLRGLYAITPDWSDTARLLAATDAILRAGCRILQYRNKQASQALRQAQAQALRQLTLQHEARLLINDDIELALNSGADGVHLGETDGQLDAARLKLNVSGPDKWLGASCYQSLPMALRAAQAGADYLAFGSFFASPTKPLANRANPGLIAAAKHETGLPICAIGGITTANAVSLIEAGADMLAVISALYDAPDPYQASLEFIQLFQKQKPTRNPHDLA